MSNQHLELLLCRLLGDVSIEAYCASKNDLPGYNEANAARVSTMNEIRDLFAELEGAAKLNKAALKQARIDHANLLELRRYEVYTPEDRGDDRECDSRRIDELRRALGLEG